PSWQELTSNQTFLSSKNVVHDTVYSSSSTSTGVSSRLWMHKGVGKGVRSSSVSLLDDVSERGVPTLTEGPGRRAGLEFLHGATLFLAMSSAGRFRALGTHVRRGLDRSGGMARVVR